MRVRALPPNAFSDVLALYVAYPTFEPLQTCRRPARRPGCAPLRRTGPLAVSSANVHGNDAALTIADAVAQLGDACSVYLDAGEMAGPVPSTIVDLTGPRARVLRAGRITVQELNEAVPGLVEQSEESHEG